MEHLKLSEQGRIRVLKHAINLIDAFENDFKEHLDSGRIEMNNRIRHRLRVNATKRVSLLAKLNKLHIAELATEGSPSHIANLLGELICREAPGLRPIPYNEEFTSTEQLQVTPDISETYRLSITSSEKIKYSEQEERLKNALSRILPQEISKSDGEIIAVLSNTIEPDDAPAQFKDNLRSFELTINKNVTAANS